MTQTWGKSKANKRCRPWVNSWIAGISGSGRSQKLLPVVWDPAFSCFFRLNPSPGWWELKIPDFLLLWLLNPPLLAGLNSCCFPRFPGNAFFRTEPDVWGFFGINPQRCARSGAREWAWGGNSWSFLHRDRVLKDGREDLGMVLGCGEGAAQPGSSLENIWSSPQGLGKGEMQI